MSREHRKAQKQSAVMKTASGRNCRKMGKFACSGICRGGVTWRIAHARSVFDILEIASSLLHLHQKRPGSEHAVRRQLKP